jgi:hypothetical protein
VPALKQRKPANKPKSPPLDLAEAMSAAGWYVKRVYEQLSERMDKIEAAMQGRRRARR